MTARRPSPPPVPALEIARGAPGSIVRTSLVGSGLKEVTALSFSGSGVLATIVGRRRGVLEVSIAIAADATPGPRAVQLTGARGTPVEIERPAGVFHVLPQSSYARAGGIGSHLI